MPCSGRPGFPCEGLTALQGARSAAMTLLGAAVTLLPSKERVVQERATNLGLSAAR